MDVADIITEFGAYYINQGQNMNRLVQQLRFTSKTDMVMTPFVTDETIYRASESRTTRILQPFQKAWTPISEVEFVPIEIKQFKIKADTQDYPDDLEGTWLGFLAANSLDRREWPFVRWWIEMHIIPQLNEDWELNEVYAGVQAAPAPGVAGGAGTAINGLRKQINDNITGGRITPISTGAPQAVAADFVTQVEDFIDAIDPKYWMVPMELCMNQTLERKFHRGYRDKYGQNTDYRQNNRGAVDFSNITVVGLPSMVGSDKWFCTPKSNMLVLGKKTVNQNQVRVENVDRLVKIFTDFWKGVGFLIPEIVYTNDQDLV